jgi:ubiquinone/menaquinone biosynthesis C-methylase UbiE
MKNDFRNALPWSDNSGRITKIGDYARYAALGIANPKTGEVFLDAGCGTGFISQRLARLNVTVFGCDYSRPMLREAESQEKINPLGIQYRHADIASFLPYDDEQFDVVICVAVLMHCSQKECQKFFQESRRVLKPRGRLIISIVHPDLYLLQLHTPSDWVSFSPPKNMDPDQSQRFGCTYRSYNKEILFEGSLWRHPKEILISAIQQNEFEVSQTQSIWVNQQRLSQLGQTGKSGPGHFQILAHKT